VLGDMAELGESAQDSHAHMGAYARECGIKRLFALGPLSSRAVETFGSGGEWFVDADSLIRRLQAELSPGVTVLIKGSRINRLERVVQALTGGGAGSDPMMRAS
jgi:UDP-N-acetylmuramoyl-tripeptide--D-alanyl-D-alanine ligase